MLMHCNGCKQNTTVVTVWKYFMGGAHSMFYNFFEKKKWYHMAHTDSLYSRPVFNGPTNFQIDPLTTLCMPVTNFTKQRVPYHCFDLQTSDWFDVKCMYFSLVCHYAWMSTQWTWKNVNYLGMPTNKVCVNYFQSSTMSYHNHNYWHVHRCHHHWSCLSSGAPFTNMV